MGKSRLSQQCERTTWVVFAASVALLASACGDDAVDERASQKAVKSTAAHRAAWLELKSDVTPEQWLASRGEESVRASDDPEVSRLRAVLDQAHRIYRESTRMIANRAVQIETMLAQQNIDEPAPRVLEDLAAVAGEVGQTEGFGAVSQHYVNMRSSGLDRATVLATLKSRYGRRS